MKKVKSFEDLVIWQKARGLCNCVHQHILSQKHIIDFPLKNQMNRASGSVMDNIAEGFGRKGNREFISFLTIANGSLMEVKSQLYRALDRSYIEESVFKIIFDISNEIEKMIYAFIRHISSSSLKGQKFAMRE